MNQTNLVSPRAIWYVFLDQRGVGIQPSAPDGSFKHIDMELLPAEPTLRDRLAEVFPRLMARYPTGEVHVYYTLDASPATVLLPCLEQLCLLQCRHGFSLLVWTEPDPRSETAYDLLGDDIDRLHSGAPLADA